MDLMEIMLSYMGAPMAKIAETTGKYVYREMWLSSLERNDTMESYTERIKNAYARAYSDVMSPHSQGKIFTSKELFARLWPGEQEQRFNESLSRIYIEQYKSGTFPEFIDKRISSTQISTDSLIFGVLKKHRDKLIRLTPELIESLKEISPEYMIWLKKYPSNIEQVNWEAFESIIAEIFSSRGFTVERTAKLRNRSADLIAIQTNKEGKDIKYLIECKSRTKGRTTIGIDIAHQVLGAALTKGFQHALLVTNSSFSRDVINHISGVQFDEYFLDLADGNEIREWLKNYSPRNDFGLWIEEN
jgi:hypothetical protein